MFFSNWADLFRIFIIGISSYISLIMLVRISGKRTLSKMNAFDFTVSVAIGSTLSAVIMNKQISLSEGLSAFAVLIGMQYLLAKVASRSKWFENILQSDPELLYYEGNYMSKTMKKNRIDRNDIYQSARSQGISSMSEVGVVILETNGKLSVIKSSEESSWDTLQDVDTENSSRPSFRKKKELPGTHQ